MKQKQKLISLMMAVLCLVGLTAIPTVAAEEDEATVIDVTWNFGYVGSAMNTGGFANQIAVDNWYYSYTDVITVEKAGTRIWFTDSDLFPDKDKGFASGSAYVFSSWKEEGGEWVIDLTRGNYAGNATEICTPGAGSMTYTYVTSVDNEHLRLCYRSGQRKDFTPEMHPEIYMQYTGETGTSNPNKPDPLTEWLEASKKEYYADSLAGLTLNVIGDSYVAGHTMDPKYVWPSLLALKYEMTFQNYGINGSSISDYTTNNNPMVNRYPQMADNDPDIVILEGGKNDYNISAPIGTNEDTTSKTFKGAVKTMIDGLREKYPNAMIVCVTVWEVGQTNSIGKKVADYGKAMREVCEANGVPCFDATDVELSGVKMNDLAFRTEYCLTPTDISHLNEKGHQLVLPRFERFIAEAYESFLAPSDGTSSVTTEPTVTTEETTAPILTPDPTVTTEASTEEVSRADAPSSPLVTVLAAALSAAVAFVLGFLVGKRAKSAS